MPDSSKNVLRKTFIISAWFESDRDSVSKHWRFRVSQVSQDTTGKGFKDFDEMMTYLRKQFEISSSEE